MSHRELNENDDLKENEFPEGYDWVYLVCCDRVTFVEQGSDDCPACESNGKMMWAREKFTQLENQND